MRRMALLTLVLFSTPIHAQDDRDQLKGKWKAYLIEKEGRTIDEPVKMGVIVSFDGDKFSYTAAGQELVGTYILNSARKPKTIDIQFGSDAPRLGIYELDGDTLKICGNEPGEDRPEEFKTFEGSPATLTLFKRASDS